ncbi:hypothetical protein EGM_13115, partial [Macaca fascicularis]
LGGKQIGAGEAAETAPRTVLWVRLKHTQTARSCCDPEPLGPVAAARGVSTREELSIVLKGRFRRCRPENRLECCLRAVLPASPEPVQTLALTPACRRHCCLVMLHSGLSSPSLICQLQSPPYPTTSENGARIKPSRETKWGADPNHGSCTHSAFL